MAVTSLWARSGRVDQVIDYVRNILHSAWKVPASGHWNIRQDPL